VVLQGVVGEVEVGTDCVDAVSSRRLVAADVVEHGTSGRKEKQKRVAAVGEKSRLGLVWLRKNFMGGSCSLIDRHISAMSTWLASMVCRTGGRGWVRWWAELGREGKVGFGGGTEAKEGICGLLPWASFHLFYYSIFFCFVSLKNSQEATRKKKGTILGKKGSQKYILSKIFNFELTSFQIFSRCLC
jgi:hypothetical protein